MIHRRQLLRTLPFAAAGMLVSCEQPEPPPRFRLPKQPIEVITSTVQAADLLREVGKEAVNVRSLIPPQVNPHLWQPTAADLAAIQIADVFILSGLGLEARFTSDVEALRSHGLFVGILSDGLDESDILKKPDGKPEPHFWMNPALWSKAAKEAARVLGEAAPRAANYFGDNAHEYNISLERAHQEALRKTADIPPPARFVLTSHDSMAYFSAAYRLEVRSMATAVGEASSKPSEELANWIGAHNIRNLFREQLADLQTIRQIARPLLLASDSQIFSLSLAKEGTRFAGIASELEVDRYLPAFAFTVDSIVGRLESR